MQQQPTPCEHAKDHREDALKHRMTGADVSINRATKICSEQQRSQHGRTRNRIQQRADQHRRADSDHGVYGVTKLGTGRGHMGFFDHFHHSIEDEKEHDKRTENAPGPDRRG